MLILYDSEGNLIEDKPKHLKFSYDWRKMFKKILFVFLFVISAAFAGFPSPVKSANIRVVYIVDTFDDDVIDTWCLNGVQEFEFKSPYAR